MLRFCGRRFLVTNVGKTLESQQVLESSQYTKFCFERLRTIVSDKSMIGWSQDNDISKRTIDLLSAIRNYTSIKVVPDGILNGGLDGFPFKFPYHRLLSQEFETCKLTKVKLNRNYDVVIDCANLYYFLQYEDDKYSRKREKFSIRNAPIGSSGNEEAQKQMSHKDSWKKITDTIVEKLGTKELNRVTFEHRKMLFKTFLDSQVIFRKYCPGALSLNVALVSKNSKALR